MRTAREKEAYSKLFSYHIYKQLIREFEGRAMCQQRKADAPYIGGTYRSDPAARGGVMLADPPPRMKLRMDWCAAIEDAWAECLALDEVYCRGDRGIAGVMEKYFCLSGGPRARERNAMVRREICIACGISMSTFYEWIGRIVDVVMYHARERGLL